MSRTIKTICNAVRAVLLLVLCSSVYSLESINGPSDPDATPETRALFVNLRSQMGKKLYFGHQNTLLEGVGWDRGKGVSDIKKISDRFPSVYGWDFGRLRDSDQEHLNLLVELVKKAFNQGGINTISWHMSNPVTLTDSWDVTPAIKEILPGGSKHEFYKSQLNKIAEVVEKLKDDRGTAIPIIFRPFHEHNQSWFWWGKPHASKAQYIELFRFTVNYFRNVKKIHQFSYAYSPSDFLTEAEYLEYYPGDEFVDVIGHDNYHDTNFFGNTRKFVLKASMIAKIAISKKKIPALTEVGDENVPYRFYWTQKILGPLSRDKYASQNVYILFWRNDSLKHFFAPYPGHKSVNDFLKMLEHPWIKMDDDKTLYQLPR